METISSHWVFAGTSKLKIEKSTNDNVEFFNSSDSVLPFYVKFSILSFG